MLCSSWKAVAAAYVGIDKSYVIKGSLPVKLSCI